MPTANSSTRSTLRKLVGVLAVSFVLFAVPARLAGFNSPIGPSFMMLLVAIATWMIVARTISAQWANTAGQKTAVYLVTSVGMVVFFVVEIQVLGLAIKYLLPRPVFHNEFVWHERALLPGWYPEIPRSDEFGQGLLADHRDNLLVMVLSGVPEAVEQPWLFGKTREFSARVGTREAGKTITLPRTKDAFVLILPDGRYKPFPLRPGLAEQFDDRIEDGGPKNFLRLSRGILDASSQAEFDAFVAAYREPLPPRPLFRHEHGPDTLPTAPYWHPPEPRSDSSGNLAWADDEFNLLVIVKQAVHSGQRGDAYFVANGFTFSYPAGRGPIDVPCSKNTLVVVRPDGATKQFPLGIGSAERFRKPQPESSGGDLLGEAAALLPENTRRDFEEFAGENHAQTQPVQTGPGPEGLP